MRTAIHENLLSIKEFCEFIGLNPWYMSQIGQGVPLRSRGQTEFSMFQYAYQNAEHLSREEIAQAIVDAEYMFAGVAKYWPAPKFIVAEQVSPNPYHTAELYSTMYRRKFFHKTVETRYRKIQAIGTRTLTEAEADVAVTRADNDGDGITEVFTATATVPAGTLASEVKCFFSEGDRVDLDLLECEIRPVRVSVSGVTATITGAAYLLVPPDLEIVLDPDDLDATDATTYVTTIDVYTETVDLSQGGQLQWEIPDCISTPCTVDVNTPCFGGRNAEIGILSYIPATYTAATETWARDYPDYGWRDPDRIFVNYRAGYPRDSRTNEMDRTHRDIIARMAAALLPNKTCGDKRADQRLHVYQQPPRDDANAALLSDFVANNPFGMARGFVEAWRMMAIHGLVALDVVGTGGA